MRHASTVSSLALLLAGVFAGGDALACRLTDWPTVVRTGADALRVGGPQDAQAVARYAGKCALRVTAPGNYVADDSATAEPSLRVRFYVYTGLASGSATVFRARNAADVDQVQVRLTPGAIGVAAGDGAFVDSQPVQRDHWYAVEVTWSAGASVTARIQGAGGPALPLVQAGPAAAGEQIERFALGWIAGAGNGAILLDAFEARRATPVGRLCRGSADGDHYRDGNDQVQVRDEFLRLPPAAGQPDCNEDGKIDAGDRVCLRNLIAAGNGDCAASPDL